MKRDLEIHNRVGGGGKNVPQTVVEMSAMGIEVRAARPSDVVALQAVIAASARSLQSGDYSAAQIEAALTRVYGVDTQLIEDGTYFAAVSGETIVGCGGWSKHKTLFGGDHWGHREDAMLDPATDPAKIRAFFVHPDWARRGIASMLLEASESAAREEGFARAELGATLTGVKFFGVRGYAVAQTTEVQIAEATTITVVRMHKML